MANNKQGKGSIVWVAAKKKWKCEVFVKPHPALKALRKSKMCQTKSDGEVWCAQMLYQLNEEAKRLVSELGRTQPEKIAEHAEPADPDWGPSAEGSEMLYDLFIKYRDQVTMMRDEPLWERRRIMQMCRHPIAKKPLRSLTVEDGERWRDDRLLGNHSKRPVKASTVLREMTILKAALRAGCRWRFGGLSKADYPFDGLTINKRHIKSRKRIITEEEILNIKLAAGIVAEPFVAETMTQRAVLCFLFALETGLRQGEIAQLTSKDIDTQKQLVTVESDDAAGGKRTKTASSEREVPLSPRAMELLKYVPDHDEETVFGIGANKCSVLFSRMRTKAGYNDGQKDGFTFHDSRHNALTSLAKIPGMTITRLQMIAGHADMNQTAVYINESIDVVVDLLNKHHAKQTRKVDTETLDT